MDNMSNGYIALIVIMVGVCVFFEWNISGFIHKQKIPVRHKILWDIVALGIWLYICIAVFKYVPKMFPIFA